MQTGPRLLWPVQLQFSFLPDSSKACLTALHRVLLCQANTKPKAVQAHDSGIPRVCKSAS